MKTKTMKIPASTMEMINTEYTDCFYNRKIVKTVKKMTNRRLIIKQIPHWHHKGRVADMRAKVYLTSRKRNTIHKTIPLNDQEGGCATMRAIESKPLNQAAVRIYKAGLTPNLLILTSSWRDYDVLIHKLEAFKITSIYSQHLRGMRPPSYGSFFADNKLGTEARSLDILRIMGDIDIYEEKPFKLTRGIYYKHIPNHRPGTVVPYESYDAYKVNIKEVPDG